VLQTDVQSVLASSSQAHSASARIKKKIDSLCMYSILEHLEAEYCETEKVPESIGPQDSGTIYRFSRYHI
jgi:hypothetical protein